MHMRKFQFAPGSYYHICNRSNDEQTIFVEERDYARFLFFILFHQASFPFFNIGRQTSWFVKHQMFNISDELINRGVQVYGDKLVFPGDFIAVQTSPFLLFIVIIFTLQRGAAAFGSFRGHLERKAKKVSGIKTTFADVAGLEDAVFELKEIVEFLKNPASFKEFGYEVPRGVLLEGPPGCGKTLLARAVAGASERPFFELPGQSIGGILVGAGSSKISEAFEMARKLSPCVLFIDEIDAVARSRGGGFGDAATVDREQTVLALCHEIDGLAERDEVVVVIGATNRPELLDQALLRPGRFGDKQIFIGPPTRKGRKAILEIHTKNRPLADNVDLEKLSRLVPGFTGAHLEKLANFAAGQARREYNKSALIGNTIGRLLPPKKIYMRHF